MWPEVETNNGSLFGRARFRSKDLWPVAPSYPHGRRGEPPILATGLRGGMSPEPVLERCDDPDGGGPSRVGEDWIFVSAKGRKDSFARQGGSRRIQWGGESVRIRQGATGSWLVRREGKRRGGAGFHFPGNFRIHLSGDGFPALEKIVGRSAGGFCPHTGEVGCSL